MKNLLYLLFVLPLLFSCGDWESPTYCHQCSEEINGAPYDSIKNPFDQNEYVYICSPRCMKDKQRKKNLQQNKKKWGIVLIAEKPTTKRLGATVVLNVILKNDERMPIKQLNTSGIYRPFT